MYRLFFCLNGLTHDIFYWLCFCFFLLFFISTTFQINIRVTFRSKIYLKIIFYRLIMMVTFFNDKRALFGLSWNHLLIKISQEFRLMIGLSSSCWSFWMLSWNIFFKRDLYICTKSKKRHHYLKIVIKLEYFYLQKTLRDRRKEIASKTSFCGKE